MRFGDKGDDRLPDSYQYEISPHFLGGFVLDKVNGIRRDNDRVEES